MTFPEAELPISVQMFLRGAWVDFGPFTYIHSDHYTDVYEDVYGGKLAINTNRLPDQQIDLGHGRADERSAADPASVSVLLWNHDGLLTPNNWTSPYWPDVKVGARFRVKRGDHVLFRGAVAELPMEWPFGSVKNGGNPLLDEDGEPLLDEDDEPLLDEVQDPGISFIRVVASGRLRRLGQGSKPLRSPIHRLAFAPQNIARISDYFPCEDGADSTQFASAFPDRAPILFHDLAPASYTGLPGSEALPSTSGDSAWTAPLVGTSGEWVFELFVEFPDVPVFGEFVRFTIATTGGGIGWWIIDIFHDGAQPMVKVRSYSTARVLLSEDDYVDPPGLFTGQALDLRFEITPSGGSTDWWLVWSGVFASADTLFGFPGAVAATTGRATSARGESKGVGYSFGHVFVHSIPGGWLVPADSAWLNELADDRGQRLAAEEGVSLTIEELADFPSTPMGPQRALPFLDLMQEAADATDAILCEQRNLDGLHWISRSARYNRPVAMVLDAAQSHIANPYGPTWDDQRTRNDIVRSRVDGSSVRELDQAHIDEHGLYDESLAINVAQDGLLADAVGWALHVGTWDGQRVAQVTIDFAVRPDLMDVWDAMTPTQVGRRIQVVNLPPQAFGEVDLIIEGYEDGPASARRSVTINCSAAGPWTVGVWEDPVLGRADTAGCELAEDIGPDDTVLSLLIAVPGDEWTTDDEDFPFDLRIGVTDRREGEIVTVLDITGSSPQTATVTRGVNGHTRSWPAGSDVRLAHPMVLAR